MCLAVLNSKRSNIVELLIVTFAIFTLPIMHLAINIVFAFPWNDCNIQNYAKGLGVNRVYYGQCDSNEYAKIKQGKKGSAGRV